MEGPLKNPRHEQFAILVAGGSTQADAYRKVYPKSRRSSDDVVHVMASRLAVKVSIRVKELQQAVAGKAVIDKAKAVEVLAEILLMAPKDVTADSRFAQEMTVDPITGKVTIRLPSKIGAFSELAKALGWYEPEKREHSFGQKPPAKILALLEGQLRKM